MSQTYWDLRNDGMSDENRFAWESAEIISASKIRDTDKVRVIFESRGERREDVFRPFFWTVTRGPIVVWPESENRSLNHFFTHKPEMYKATYDVLTSALNGHDSGPRR